MNTSKIILFLSVFSIFFFGNSQSNNDQLPKRIYNTKAINSEDAPVIDGKIDDAIWQKAEKGSKFIEYKPAENTEPVEETEFKILYDNKYLYVALRAYDKEPENIVNRLSRRDGFDGDRINFLIDSYHDLRTAFVFTVTAAGVKGDEISTNNGEQWDASWNPIWYTKANIDDKGWTAEMKIPFSQLRFDSEDEQIWGLQVFRQYFRTKEESVWQRIPAGSNGFISRFGELHGIKGIKPQKQLEIQPFIVSQYNSYPEEAGNPFRDGSDFRLNGGVDAKIGITNDLTLDLTVNPDFGQVEADPGAIALDGFQIFFNEQRPFFVENKNIFDYQFANGQDNLFYSRRVGRSPQGALRGGNGVFVDNPQNTTILGATKFSGKTKNGWSIGVLESVTAKEYTEVDTNGNRKEIQVEPLTNYFVSRVQKDFNEGNTFIGGIFTATNREKLPEQLDFLHKAAYSGGLDANHQWKNREWYAKGNIVLSHVTGSKEAIAATQASLTHLFGRVDASHVEIDPNRTSLTGTGGRIEAGRQGGGNWTYNAGAIWRSPELELNDIGFLRQADEIRQFANIGWKTLQPTGNFREISGGLEQFSTYDFEGNYNRIEYQLKGNFKFQNNWWIDFALGHKPRIYTNTFLRGGPRWRFSQENYGLIFFGSNEQKKFRTSLGVVYSSAKQNNFSFFEMSGDITYQPTNALLISIQPQYQRNPNKTQYVTQFDKDDNRLNFNGDNRYILGEIDNEVLSAALRINYTINPNLSIQYYAQPFIFKATYNNFKRVTNPIADDLNDRFYQFSENEISNTNGYFEIDEDANGTVDYNFRNPDFSAVQFRSNLVARWEYIPGSEVFLVWSQGINSFVNPNDGLFDGLDAGIIDEQPDNIFLIKATYRFVL